MSEQTVKKQIAREFYNVIYGAKLSYASLDICEKLPSIISFLSLSLGVLGLSFEEFNNKVLASALLIGGILGIMLKPREMQKSEYIRAAKTLTELSKKLELLHSEVDTSSSDSETLSRTKLEVIQAVHTNTNQPAPVFLASWYAHYKLFSEHNNKWFCDELNLSWKDKVPLSFRAFIIALIIGGFMYIKPDCLLSQSWTWIEARCSDGCWNVQLDDNERGDLGTSPSLESEVKLDEPQLSAVLDQ